MLVFHKSTSVKDFSQVLRMPQAVTADVEELTRFVDSHGGAQPGWGRRGPCHLHAVLAWIQLSAAESAAGCLGVVVPG